MTAPRVVYLAHPAGAPTVEEHKANLARAKRWFDWMARLPGIAPTADWLTYCEVWSDFDPELREKGLQADDTMITRCDEFWMVGGRISSGMERGKRAALRAGVIVRDLTRFGAEPPEQGVAVAIPAAIIRQMPFRTRELSLDAPLAELSRRAGLVLAVVAFDADPTPQDVKANHVGVGLSLYHPCAAISPDMWEALWQYASDLAQQVAAARSSQGAPPRHLTLEEFMAASSTPSGKRTS